MKINRTIINFTILSIIVIAILMYTKFNPFKPKTYYLIPQVTAPELYPCMLFDGWLYFENGTSVGLPTETWLGTTGWANRGADAFMGQMPVPVSMKLTWASFAEKKFYTGTFPLNHQLLDSLFQQTYVHSTKSPVKLNKITIGLAPGGRVMVWVGGDQYVFEAGQYQAKDTVVKIEDTFPMAHTFDPVAWCERKLSFEPAILDNLQKNGIPFGLWDTYRERFNIKPVIEFEDQENCILDYISMQFINGEEDVLVEETLKNYTWQPRPRFSFIEFGWSCKRDLFITEIIFNEEEIFKAYRFIYQNNPMQEAILRIHVNKGNHFTSVFLENTDPQNHREVEFYKAEIKRYPLDEDDRVHFTAFKHENNDDKK